MRGRCWLLLCLAACGSVKDTGIDAPAQGDDAPNLPDAPVAAPGTVRWVRSLSALSGTGIVDGPGGLVVAGYFSAPTDLGAGPYISAGSYDMAVAGFNTDTGGYLYSTHFGDTGQEFAWTRNVDSSGAPIAYGVSYGAQQNVGTGQVAGGGGPGSDGFIGKYGSGPPTWMMRMVGPGEDKFVGSARGPGSTIYGLGWFENTTVFNGGTLTGSGREVLLARFNTFTGAVDLTKTFGGVGRDEGGSAASSNGNLVIAGFFDDTINFGGTAPALTASGGGLDTWVAKIDTVGNGVWADRFGGTGDDRDPEVAMDAAGDVYIAGSFGTQIAFGAINLTAVGMSDVFVAKLRGSDGAVVWATSFGSIGNDSVGSISVDGAGHVAVAALAGGPIDGGTSAGGNDAVIASFEATTGANRFRKVFSTSADDGAGAVGYGANGELYALLNLGAAYDFGLTIMGAANPAGVLVRLAP